MKILESNLKTTVITDDEQKRVYEICRERLDVDSNNQETIILTLYPTTADPSKYDLTSFHCLNHADDDGLRFAKIHFVFLFSDLVNGKPSAKKLKLDEKNFEYIKDLITRIPSSRLVIAYGSCYEKNSTVKEAKTKFFQMLKEIMPDKELWQLHCETMDEGQEAMHLLYAGVRYGKSSLSLRHYVVPYCYTEDGYKAYMEQKAVARERFIQNVLGKKGNATTKLEKTKKGKKKDVLQN